MKKTIIAFIITTLTACPAFAHYLWIETSASGELGNRQEVKVYFGEYTYGVLEKVDGEGFPKVANFDLWLVAPDGKKENLKVKQKKDHYVAYFTPSQEGTFTVILNNNEIEVIDYTQYDFGIFKTHYHSTAKVLIGNNKTNTTAQNEKGLAIMQLPSETDQVKLQIWYQGKPLPKQEVKIFQADLWEKSLTTDENGMISFSLPWDTKYIVETTLKEEIPGNYNGKDYEFIWHCATFCIK